MQLAVKPAATVAPEKPTAQALHAEEPEALVVEAGHAAQARGEELPEAGENVPSVHLMQAALDRAAGVVEYDPGLQIPAQVDAPKSPLYRPALQGKQVAFTPAVLFAP